MKHEKSLIFISAFIFVLFTLSFVNAGIFEFAEDTSEVDDADYNDDIDNSDIEIKKFKIKNFKSISVSDKISELENKMGNGESEYFETVLWLDEFDDYVLFSTAENEFIVVNVSESDKISKLNDLSYCTVECEVVETTLGVDTDYYLVKNINVIKKVEKKTKNNNVKQSPKSVSSSSSSKSSSSSDSSKQVSNSNQDSHPTYVGNAATGKFHAYSCHDVNRIKSSNMVYFDTRDDAVNNGYSPCGHCRP